jgi:RNA polymerase sigma-70 factor (ECF subfamily)
MTRLAARLACGEEAAFVELYEACADRLHHYVAVRLGSRDVAADVVQSAFLKAVKGRRHFRNVQNPVAYMFQIARNEARRTAKSRRRLSPLPVDELFSATGRKSVPDDDADAVITAIGRLETDDRELVELKIFGGLTLQEIADVTNLPPGTVATRYRRALASLRGWLQKQFR